MDTFTSKENPRDWRGVPIKVDALVLYGATVGRSVAMVEAEVVGFTESGRVTLRPVRRAYGSSADWGWSTTRKTVHVGQDRLTVVGVLPDSELPTEDERLATAAMKERAKEFNLGTHDMATSPLSDRTGIRDATCLRCEADYWNAREEPCA